MKKIMVTGAAGQIGSELMPFLRERYGNDNVFATDIVNQENESGTVRYITTYHHTGSN
jgi:nucleoside-diphosphate-sugar epimerase